MTSENEDLENPFASYSDEELEKTEIELLSQAGTRFESTDEEYERHYEYIRRVRKSHASTHKQFTNRSKYSPEREVAHDALIENLHEAYAQVPNEGKAVFIGGMPGSGKSSLLRLQPNLLNASYAPVNPDLIKNAMVEFSLAPEIPGLLPLETDELIRYEAGILDARLLSELISQRKNILIDRTMGSASQIMKLVTELNRHGYDSIQGLFMDIDPQDGYERIKARHRAGLDSYLINGKGIGERPVPGSAVVASRPKEGSPFRTANAAVFYELAQASVFTETPRVFDAMSGEEITVENLKTTDAS